MTELPLDSNHVFISYARADGAKFTGKLHDDLTAFGINTWLDIRDIKAGENFRLAIDRGLLSARAVTVVLTPASVLSDEVTAEWTDALSRYVPVIPLWVQNCRIPPRLSLLNYIDFRTDYDEGLKALVARLSTLERDHLAYLKGQLDEFRLVQQSADQPSALQPKINTLHELIEVWTAREQNPQQHIAAALISDALAAERQRLSQLAVERAQPERRKVVGQRIAVTDLFHDRIQPQRRISELLASTSTRLISIIGRAGIGKSGLVSKVLEDIEHNRWAHLLDGSPLPSLGGIVITSSTTRGITLERIFLDFADLLGGDERAQLRSVWANPGTETEDKVAQLVSVLKDGGHILLIDNIDTIFDDSGRITDSSLNSFLRAALTTPGGPRIIATSRMPLTLDPDLARLDNRVRLDEGLPVPDGVAMLRELDLNGEFGVRERSDTDLSRLTERVHGVPRALQIAVSIFADNLFITLDELVESFFQQDNVEDLVRENYRRLDESSRRVMEALAVFGRPVPAVAVQFMLESILTPVQVTSLLNRLAYTHSISVDRATRTISLHPFDRSYIYTHLPRTGETSVLTLEALAADYYAQIRLPQEEWTDIDALEPQLRELEHRIRAQQYQQAHELVNELDLAYLIPLGHLDGVLEMRSALRGHLEDPVQHSVNEGGIGNVYLNRRNFKQAIAAYEPALEHARQHGLADRQIRMLRNLAVAYLNQGEVVRAQEYLSQALPLVREHGDKVLLAATLETQAGVQLQMGQVEASVALREEALAIAREIDHLHLQIVIPLNMAQSYNYLGRYQDIIDLLVPAIEKLRAANHVIWLNGALTNRGMAHHSLGQYEAALTSFQEALQIGRDLGDPYIQATNLTNIGLSFSELGEFEQALNSHNEALAIAREQQNKVLEANVMDNLGVLYIRQKDYTKAIETIEQALVIARESGDALNEQEMIAHLAEARGAQAQQQQE